MIFEATNLIVMVPMLIFIAAAVWTAVRISHVDRRAAVRELSRIKTHVLRRRA